MKAKICGMTSLEMTRSVIQYKPDHIGFVFAESRRQVSPTTVNSILHTLQEEGREIPHTVGVFAGVDVERVKPVIQGCSMQALQFHAGEHLDICRWIKENSRTDIWLTLPIASGDSMKFVDLLDEQFERLSKVSSYFDVLLLDTFDPIQGGGSGKVFQWDVIPAYLTRAKAMGVPLYAAGGLNPENVEDLTSRYSLDGVDVSSGVETDGTKDIKKVASFIERVRHHVSA